MSSENVCPYCGGEVRTTCEYRTKWGNWRATVACDAGHSINFRMQMSGNASIPTVSARAIDAFCHPAHLMEGKVMVSKDDLESLLTMHDCGACCGDIDEITNRLKAAIYAAGGGK